MQYFDGSLWFTTMSNDDASVMGYPSTPWVYEFSSSASRLPNRSCRSSLGSPLPERPHELRSRISSASVGLLASMTVSILLNATGFHPKLPTQLLYSGNKGLEFAQVIGTAHPCTLPEALVAVVCIPQHMNRVLCGCAGVQGPLIRVSSLIRSCC